MVLTKHVKVLASLCLKIKLHIRQAKGSNEANLRVDLMTDDNQQIKNATVSNNGSWTEVSTGIDSAAFLRIPTGLKRNPIVEYYVEYDAGIILPTFRKMEINKHLLMIGRHENAVWLCRRR